EIHRSRCGIGVINEIVCACRFFDGRSMSGAFPVAVGTNDRVRGIFCPWAEQMVSTRNALGIAACSSAACIAGIEEIEVSLMTHDVGRFHNTALPRRGVVHDELRWSTGEMNQIVREWLGP